MERNPNAETTHRRLLPILCSFGRWVPGARPYRWNTLPRPAKEQDSNCVAASIRVIEIPTETCPISAVGRKAPDSAISAKSGNFCSIDPTGRAQRGGRRQARSSSFFKLWMAVLQESGYGLTLVRQVTVYRLLRSPTAPPGSYPLRVKWWKVRGKPRRADPEKASQTAAGSGTSPSRGSAC